MMVAVLLRADWVTRMNTDPRWRSVAIMLGLTILAAMPWPTLAGNAGEGATNAVSALSFQLRDGARLDYFSASTPDSQATTLVILINGSGCDSVEPFFNKMSQRLGDDLSGLSLDVMELQKQGVGLNGHALHYGTSEGCSAEYLTNNDFDRRVQAQRQFLRYLLEKRKQAYRHVVVVGASDGGIIAAALAAAEPAVTNLVLIGSGGLRQVDELRILQPRGAFASLGADELETAYAAIKRRPVDTKTFFLGQPYRYWNDVLYIDPLSFLLKLDIPVMVGMGEKDMSTPVESVYYLRDAFAKGGKRNLTLRIYPGADHGLRVGEQSHMDDFLRGVGRWLDESKGSRSQLPN